MLEVNVQGRFEDKVNKLDQNKLKKFKIVIIVTAVVLIVLSVMAAVLYFKGKTKKNASDYDMPEFDGEVFTVINGNIPYFDPDAYGDKVFEIYSELDEYGRCGVAFANICKEIMPVSERESIGQIRPSGWKQEKYPGVVDSDPPYLFNRCHLIGFQLAGENANEKNLITGTRFFNVEGMLPFENRVREYVENTNHHVLYRVTPVFTANNLVADGVLIEAWSVEDNGKGISFNVFVYNIQPGVVIDYEDGSSHLQ